MCELDVAGAEPADAAKQAPGLTRRGALIGAGAALGGTALALGATGPAQASSSGRRPRPVPTRGMHVFTLGTQGGPGPTAGRTGIATAVVVDEAVYLIDVGRSAVTQYVDSGLLLANLRGVFITHLHADHVADYMNLVFLGANRSPGPRDTLPSGIPTYGPGPAGELPPTYGGGSSPTINPTDPTPGLAGLTAYAQDSFAYSSNVFMRDSGVRDPREILDVHEIAVPAGTSMTNPAPAMQPFAVMQDDHVSVTAILVPHGPVFPAFAFRIDSRYGSVTVSGDTTYTDNIPVIGAETDMLVHEAINLEGFAGSDALKSHLIESHVLVQDVGEIAEACGARRLVLSHTADLAAGAIPVAKWRRWARRGFSGRVSVAAEGDRFTVAA